jgi:hypothetical protein
VRLRREFSNAAPTLPSLDQQALVTGHHRALGGPALDYVTELMNEVEEGVKAQGLSGDAC